MLLRPQETCIVSQMSSNAYVCMIHVATYCNFPPCRYVQFRFFIPHLLLFSFMIKNPAHHTFYPESMHRCLLQLYCRLWADFVVEKQVYLFGFDFRQKW